MINSRDRLLEVQGLLNRGQLETAQGLAEQVLAEHESRADVHSLLASVLDRRGQWQLSLKHLQRAHELMPYDPQMRLNLAMALLRMGRYREGFELYEARLDKPTWSGFATLESRIAMRSQLLAPHEAVEGRGIVLLAEQGLGDSIMCARYIPMLAQRGARIAVASSPTLRPFFARVPGIEALLSPPADQPLGQINLTALQFDAWLPLLSLPRWFGTELPNISQLPYWIADQALLAKWRTRISAAGRQGRAKIGLVFQANPEGAAFLDKSMQISDLTSLLSLENVDFVNLQHGPAGRELAAAMPGIIDPLSTPLPLDEYAAVIAATDLLVTADTMAAHLSGAMGHATWVVVPQSPHWMWGIASATTPWYSSTEIFRQKTNRDWSGAIASIDARLHEKFGTTARSEADPIAHGQQAGSRAETSPVNSSRDQRAVADPAQQFELALAQLTRGELEQGFANYEARQHLPLWQDQALPLNESLIAVGDRRLRAGDPVEGRRIVVFTEQGLGDTFFGARFLRILAERGATITMVCRAPMRPFFARLPFVDTILSPPQDVPHAKIDLRRMSFDAFSPLLSLPQALGVTSTVDERYLSADPMQIDSWRARYEREGRPGRRKIGLIWQANPANAALANRSMRATDLASLLSLEHVDLVNLQHGPAGRELSQASPQIIDALRHDVSLDDFAAALAATDLVVSVDTMAAHCAGALGQPVWVMLPATPPWWWGERNDGCSLYPSARLFRQQNAEDWSPVVSEIATALRNEVISLSANRQPQLAESNLS